MYPSSRLLHSLFLHCVGTTQVRPVRYCYFLVGLLLDRNLWAPRVRNHYAFWNVLVSLDLNQGPITSPLIVLHANIQVILRCQCKMLC